MAAARQRATRIIAWRASVSPRNLRRTVAVTLVRWRTSPSGHVRALLESIFMNRSPGNLGPRACAAYLRVGLLAFGVALLASVLAVWAGVAIGWRLLLWFPFAVGWACLFDALAHTCGIRALQGVRVTDRGVEPVVDPSERRELVRRAMAIAARSAAASSITVVPFVYFGR